MNRRDFLLVRTRGKQRILELSCERLYVQYFDAESDLDSQDQEIPGEPAWWSGEPPTVIERPTSEELFRDLEDELARADVLRVRDRNWLMNGAFQDRFEALLPTFRARGGHVEYLPSQATK